MFFLTLFLPSLYSLLICFVYIALLYIIKNNALGASVTFYIFKKVEILRWMHKKAIRDS
jgi:hypothetical protein